MSSYFTISTHHKDYTIHDVERRSEGVNIWLRTSGAKDPSLAFDLDGARALRDTLNRAIAEAEADVDVAKTCLEYPQ